MITRLFLSLICIGTILALVPGCGSSPDPVGVTPDQMPACYTAYTPDSNCTLWGLWEVHIDPDKETIEAVPLRGPAFTCNVVQFVDGPPVNLLLDIENVDIQADYSDILVDIGLQHPFPGLDQFTGFDVLGVFMGDGTSVYPGPDGFPVAGESDQQLLNADGFTRWFNADEFTEAGEIMPLFGYIPGKLGTSGYNPSAILNPYKYFADGLEQDDAAFDFLVNNADDRGCFRPGSVNHRYYDLRFPTPTPGISFQYAVIANWDVPENGGASLEDFPISANAAEAVVISVVDNSTLYYVDETEFGGSAILDISVYDWSATCSGVMEEYVVKCFSDAWDGDGSVVMTAVDSGTNYYTYQTDIPATSLTSDGLLPVWIEISYPELDYSNDFGAANDADGPLAGFYKLGIPVSDEGPTEYLVYTWGGSSNDGVCGTTSDNDGNTFVVGHFRGEVDFDPGSGVDIKTASTSTFHTFMSKYDPDWNYLWTQIWPSPSQVTHDVIWLIEDSGILCDSSGNVYFTGWFTGTVDFDPGAGEDSYTSSGVLEMADVFLTKLDSEGNYLWTHVWGDEHNDCASGMVIDGSDNIYMAGQFSGTVDMDPGDGIDEHESNGLAYDNFLSKFDIGGIWQWTRSWGGPGTDGDRDICLDGTGGVYVTGLFIDTVDFDPGTGEAEFTANGYDDCFLSKFDTDGIFQWVKTWGGPNYEQGRNVVVDSSGLVYVTGMFSETVDFNPDGGVDYQTSNGEYDIFLSCFNSSDGAYLWARTWGGNLYDNSNTININSEGYVCVGGYFQDEVDFNPGPIDDIRVSNGDRDCCLSKFNSAGEYQGVWTFGDTGSDIVNCVVPDGAGSMYVSGFYSGMVDFHPTDESEWHISYGAMDCFYGRIPDDMW